MSESNAGLHADEVLRVATGEGPEAGRTLQVIGTSWRRCLNDYKLDPARAYLPTVLDERRVKDLQAQDDELVEIARAEMDSLYEQISGSGYALLLANTEGVILCGRVDPTLQRMFDRAGLIVGADWSERCEGTNGIGTCAAETRPITIHQSDHFRAQHVALTCSAAPIHDPAGRLIAVLDASSVGSQGTREAQHHTVALVNSSARLIEKCFFLRRHETDMVLRFHYRPEFVDLLHDGALVIRDGFVAAADGTSLRLLGLSRGELVGRPLTDVFDAGLHDLAASGDGVRRAIWEIRDIRNGRRYYASLAPRPHAPIRPGAHIQTARPRTPPAAERAATLSLDELAGDDARMLQCLHQARRLADRDIPILLHGPTGCGKEAFAKALHQSSGRAARPFVAVDCASIPESLIESELFGYVAGAFTGARREGMKGRILQASGGTLFLDEIGDMPFALQTRLLRVLEEREVVPLGGDRAIKVDLRVLSASHRNLGDLIARGAFREDLYYRLNGITLELPPLAARTDKERIIRACLAREAADWNGVAVDPDAIEALLAYPWPGNMRQLRNVLRAALAIAEPGRLRLADLPPEMRRTDRPARAIESASDDSASDDSAARRSLLAAIRRHHGNLSRVAAELGVSRNTLYRRLRRHRITARPDRFE